MFDKHSLGAPGAARREENGEKRAIVTFEVWRREFLLAIDARAGDIRHNIKAHCASEVERQIIPGQPRRDEQQGGVTLRHLVIKSGRRSRGVERRVCEARFCDSKDGDEEKRRARDADGDNTRHLVELGA